MILERVDRGLGTPQCPEPYEKLRRLRRFNLATFAGGLYDQPYLESLEFEAVIAAEEEFNVIRAFNQRQKNNAQQPK